MKSGTPLTDADRLPWLDAIASQMNTWTSQGKNGIIACSALKAIYRRHLCQQGAHGDHSLFRVIYLHGTHQEIFSRISNRRDHFMKAHMLESQFEALEEPPPIREDAYDDRSSPSEGEFQHSHGGEGAIWVEITASSNEIVEQIIQSIPSLRRSH
mmetsp:Transcript_28162/g.45634  ORF Transcript_28162/g.45634 Transcript_28162/m.45634 type:complete len:155 (-) Transcript_28162:309-773(-)